MKDLDYQTGMNRRDILAGATAIGAAGAAVPLLGSKPAQAAPNKGGTLRVGLPEGATTDELDPQTYTDIFMMSVGLSTHSTLTEINPDGELVGDVAESWEGSKDATTWTFKLRKGVTFSNGKDLTAQDVVTSLNLHRGEDSKSGVKAMLDPVADVKADGKDTVVLTLSAANADFPFLLADYHLLMLPDVDGKPDWQNYIGTGGYVLEDFEPGVRASVKRRDDYWKDGRAHFDSAEFLALKDISARQNAVSTGEVDVISRVDLKTVKLLARRPNVKVEEATGFLHYTAPMNTTAAPFDNNDVRLALKYAMNREELLDKVLQGHGTLANDHPIAPSVPYAAEIEQRQYDPDKAKYHWKKAGMEGTVVPLSAADTAYSGAIDAAVLMQEHAKAAGIDIEVVREPADGYWSNVWMQKPWCQCYWGGRPTCDWMFTQAYADGAAWNDTFWSHDRFNELLVMGRSELDAGNRAEIYGEMQNIVRDEGGVFVWAFANYIYAMADKVTHGANMASNWELDGARYVERWWFS